MWPVCGIKYVSWYQHSVTPNSIISRNRKSYEGCLAQPTAKAYLKLFNERVNKLFRSIIKLPECFKMADIYFSQCLCENIDINTLLQHSGYQILRYSAKFFKVTGSTNCSKYLCSECRVKHFWWNVTSRIWHSYYWKYEIVSFIVKLNVKFFMYNFDSQIKIWSLKTIYILLCELTPKKVNLFLPIKLYFWKFHNFF